MQSPDDFPARLQRLRRAAGLSQADLARAVDASRDIIGKYERGSHSPSAESAVRLARALDVTVGYLLAAEDAPADAPDPETLRRVRALDSLDDRTRETVLAVVDTFVRDARAREAYAA